MRFKACKISLCWLVILISSRTSRCDLPIHTLTKDVVGVWKIYETVPEAEFNNCGSSFPNKNADNLKIDDFKSYLDEIYGDLSESIVELSDEVHLRRSLWYPRNTWNFLSVKNLKTSSPIGSWTLVYDEGLMISIDDKNYFGYFKYSNIKTKDCKEISQGISEDEFGNIQCYVTDPTRIQIGWFSKRVNDGRLFGCFYAQKLYNFNDIYSDPATSSGANSTASSNSPVSGLLNRNYIIDLTYRTNSIGTGHFVNSAPGSSAAAAAATSSAISSGSWNRKNYSEYDDLTPFRFLQLRKGVHYFPVNSYLKDNLNLNLTDQENFNRSIYACHGRSPEKQYGNLPKNWTWGDPFSGMDEDIHLSSQGDCGSCYAHSSLYVISKRFQIVFNKLYPNKKWALKEFALSIDDLLKSTYCQGCLGGFLMLVGKHVNELGVNSSPSKGHNNVEYDNKWFIDDFGYVGGFYEATNEISMMHEIHAHGPIAVAIYAPNELFYYNNGIFDVNYKHGMVCDLPNDNFNGWEYTNHAIVIVGWGEEVVNDRKIKYWVCKNTWGVTWGVGGYFKVERGVNLLGIESQAVYFDPCLSKGVPLTLIKSYTKHSYL